MIEQLALFRIHGRRLRRIGRRIIRFASQVGWRRPQLASDEMKDRRTIRVILRDLRNCALRHINSAREFGLRQACGCDTITDSLA